MESKSSLLDEKTANVGINVGINVGENVEDDVGEKSRKDLILNIMQKKTLKFKYFLDFFKLFGKKLFV